MTLEENHPVSADVSMVTLYKGGQKVEVSASSEAAMVAEGWLSADPRDLDNTISEVKTLAATVADSYATLLASVRATGKPEARDFAALQAAHSGLSGRIRQTLTVIYAAFPTPQGEAVTMTAPDGVVHQVDPSQQEEYAGKGWEVT